MAPYPMSRSAVGPFVASLRVYEPLAAFSPAERERWQDYARSGQAPSPEQGPALERAASLAAVLRPAPACLPDVPEHAYVLEVDGVVLVCPWRTRLRGLVALTQVRADLPEVLADAVLPASAAAAAEELLVAERAEHPDRLVHVRTSSWQVPAHWFALVEAGERTVSAGGPPVPGSAAGRAAATAATTAGDSVGSPAASPAGALRGRSLVYRTAMSRARRRAARALAVLRRTVDDSTAASGVEELARWLEDFHPRSVVELDYGGLVHLLDDEALAADASAADVAEALAALDAGEGERALAAYGRVSARMKALQGVETAS